MTPQNREDPLPSDPKRVQAFALFFKRYMSISTLVVASLPIPVTALGLIPTLAVHTKLLSVYTPLFCFLMLGFIFYSRHKLARIMFPEHFTELGFVLPRWARIARSLIRSLPFFLIALCLGSVLSYHSLLGTATTNDFEMARPSPLGSSLLMLLYLSIFLTAEAAFIMMAVKEYLQDLVGLTEMDLIRGPKRTTINIKPIQL